ncbi:Arsenic efflux pump protein [uncultured Ruminococcus sp.]|jgi:Na+/H+ antiporter NhaD/arsenite permease-like protein|nr:Arsenic efflux pump protein [uncultured Ruminococcus sp.]
MLAQVLAIIIFLAMFLLIILEIWERQWITLACGLLTLLLVFGLGMHSMGAITRTLNLQSFFTTGFWYVAGESSEASSGINWQTIIFIAGMMIMVEGMAKVGFFRWLCMEIAKMVKYQVIPIFMTFMLLSFVLAMFIDSITVILFLAAVTIELSQLLEFDPVPMILSEIFCANLGGSATMCGDPPNIIIGTSLGYSFTDFITNTGLMAVVSLVFVVIYFYFAFRKELKKNGANKKDHSSYPDPKEAIVDKRGFIASCIIFLCAVVLLVSHAQTGLTVSTIGVAIAIVTLIVAGKDALELLKKVDYKTLLFFVGLFVVVSGLEETGVLEILAGFIGSVSGGNIAVMIAIIIIVSAVASAFIDNIPFAATMIPVITDLASDVAGVNLSVLAWALAIGTDIGGSATPIGASANVVGIATAAREGHIIKWGKYCKYMAPATIIVVAISLVMIYVRYL